MQVSEILGWSFNAIGLLILLATIFYLNRSVRVVEKQQLASLRMNHFEVWSRIDDVLLEYPELSELWAGLDVENVLRASASGIKEMTRIYRQRAFVSLVFETLFRSFKMREEVDLVLGGRPLEEIRLAHPAFRRMWFEGGVRDDWLLFPEYVDLVEGCFLKCEETTPMEEGLA